MTARTKQDKKDLQAARDEVWRLEWALSSARIRLTLHEAARTRGERPPKHVRSTP